MSVRVFHVAATEARTLCGLSIAQPSPFVMPFDEWITPLSLTPSQACGECRRICMQSQDRARFIRNQEALYGKSRDLFDKP